MSTLFECIALKTPGNTVSPRGRVMFVIHVNTLLSKYLNCGIIPCVHNTVKNQAQLNISVAT